MFNLEAGKSEYKKINKPEILVCEIRLYKLIVSSIDPIFYGFFYQKLHLNLL